MCVCVSHSYLRERAKCVCVCAHLIAIVENHKFKQLLFYSWFLVLGTHQDIPNLRDEGTPNLVTHF